MVRTAEGGPCSFLDRVLLRRAGIPEGSAVHAGARRVRWRRYPVSVPADWDRARPDAHRDEGKVEVSPEGDLVGAGYLFCEVMSNHDHEREEEQQKQMRAAEELL